MRRKIFEAYVQRNKKDKQIKQNKWATFNKLWEDEIEILGGKDSYVRQIKK